MNPLLIAAACLIALVAFVVFFMIGPGLDECRADLPLIRTTLCDIASRRGWL